MTISRGLYAKRGAPTLERLMFHLDTSDPVACWEYRGRRNALGYGAFGDGGKTKLAHRVMFCEKVGEIPAHLIVRHKCDNPPCCNPDHLELGTNKDNAQDMVKRGRLPPRKLHVGSANGSAKLTEEDIPVIRREYAAGGVSQNQIAMRFDVSQTLVGRIVRRKIWRHVT